MGEQRNLGKEPERSRTDLERSTSEGALLTIADPSAERLSRLAGEARVTVVKPSEIPSTACDMLSPCAIGAILDDEPIPSIRRAPCAVPQTISSCCRGTVTCGTSAGSSTHPPMS